VTGSAAPLAFTRHWVSSPGKRRPGQGGRPAGLCLLAVVLGACASLGGLRPLYGPVQGSVSVQLGGSPEAVTRAAVEEVQHAGLHVQWLSVEEGYVETQWYDLSSRGSSSEPAFRDLDRVVKMRFFADPTAGRTRLAAECVTTIMVDPSRPQRELERMAPEGHAGREMLTQVLDRLRRRFPVVEPGPTAGPP